MSVQCYTPRASSRSGQLGGLFVLGDGSQRLLPDHWLVQAELLDDARMLRLTYTSCSIEVAGRGLTPIFDDACTGKLGTIRVAPSQPAPADSLWVTSIIIVFPAPPEFPPIEEKRSDSRAVGTGSGSLGTQF
jgi:hypothetical protein